MFKLKVFNKAGQKYIYHVHIYLPNATIFIPISKSRKGKGRHQKATQKRRFFEKFTKSKKIKNKRKKTKKIEKPLEFIFCKTCAIKDLVEATCMFVGWFGKVN